MQYSSFYDIKKDICQFVLSGKDDKVVWKDRDSNLPPSLVCFPHLFADKTSSTLTISVFVASIIHVFSLLNKLLQKRDK